MPSNLDKFLENLACEMVAEIFETSTLDEIEQLIEELEIKQRNRRLH